MDYGHDRAVRRGTRARRWPPSSLDRILLGGSAAERPTVPALARASGCAVSSLRHVPVLLRELPLRRDERVVGVLIHRVRLLDQRLDDPPLLRRPQFRLHGLHDRHESIAVDLVLRLRKSLTSPASPAQTSSRPACRCRRRRPARRPTPSAAGQRRPRVARRDVLPFSSGAATPCRTPSPSPTESWFNFARMLLNCRFLRRRATERQPQADDDEQTDALASLADPFVYAMSLGSGIWTLLT